MKEVITAYPCVNQIISELLDFHRDPYTFWFSDNGEVKQLTVDSDYSDDHSFYIDDENSQWCIANYDLIIKSTLHIKNFNKLFFGEHQLAEVSSTIGLVLIWGSKDSNTRGCLSLKTYSPENEIIQSNLDVPFQFVLPKGTMTGKVTMRFCLYLSNVKHFSKQYCSITGSILGELLEDLIYLDGSGSEFPIVEIFDPNLPLWFIEKNWDDIYTDLFISENIAICLNKGNKKYKELNLENGFLNSALFMSILSSAFQEIISEVHDDADLNILLNYHDGKIEDGTIASAIRYIIDSFNIDISSPITIGKSIRKYFSERF